MRSARLEDGTRVRCQWVQENAMIFSDGDSFFGSYESTCMTRTRKAAKSDLPFDLFGSVKKKKNNKNSLHNFAKKKKGPHR